MALEAQICAVRQQKQTKGRQINEEMILSLEENNITTC